MDKWIDELKNAQKHLQKQIAAQKQQEEQLKQSLALLHSTLESAAHGIVTVNLEGEILTFNQKFVDMWQIPRSLMLSKNFSQCQAFFQNQLKNPQVLHKFIWKAVDPLDVDSCDILELKDGRFLVQHSQPQWLGDKIIGRVWSIWDITASQRAEEALKLKETRLRDLLETTNASIFLIKGFNLSYINAAAAALSGYTKEELLTDFDPHQLIKNKKHRQVNNKNLQYQEMKILEKDGTERWLTCAVATLEDLETPIEIIAGIDITDYKQAESHLSQALEQAKQLSEIRAQFMSMVCHQFRTPLNVVSFSNSLLKRHIKEWTQEKTQPLLDHIQTAVQQLSKMLDDILFFSKAEAAKINFEAKPVNLVELCQDLITQIQITGSQNPINFMSQGGDLTACMDQNLLEQILRNLLDNAIKYSPTGSTIDLKLFFECGKVVFQITDRGIGIPVADIPQLFEPFYRGGNIDNLPGTGLGLSIVKTLVDLHGGHIAVESEVDIGTTFTIMLPLVRLKS